MSETGTGTDWIQVVVFKLADKEYAAPILDVQEIIPTGEITPFPDMPAHVDGIINIRGTVATIINLSKRFHLVKTETNQPQNQYVILTNVKKTLYGMVVDDVTSVIKIKKTDIRSITDEEETSNISSEYIQGVVIQAERIILILDFLKIIG